MILKKIIFCIFALFLAVGNVFSEKTAYCRIVIYRTNSSAVDFSVYKIESNRILLTELKNKSYFTFYMPEGDLNIMATDRVSAGLDLTIVKNKNYYIRLDELTEGSTQRAKLVAVDSVVAKNELLSCTIPKVRKRATENLNPPNGIGISLGAGWGSQKSPIIKTTGNRNSTISYGGGFDLMGTYTREFYEYFGMDFDLSIQESYLIPSLSNASINFSRGRFSFRPFCIFPLNDVCTKRLKVGAGLDFYFTSVLNIKTEKLINGVNEKLYYNQPIGYHFSCVYEQFINENFTMMIGGKLSDVTYKFESSDVRGFPSDSFYSNPSGLSLYLLLGVGYHF
jgi:hypothetical protein